MAKKLSICYNFLINQTNILLQSPHAKLQFQMHAVRYELHEIHDIWFQGAAGLPKMPRKDAENNYSTLYDL